VAVPKLKTLCAVLLALLWVPVTSHCLMEDAGLIHHDACCETHEAEASHGHDAADGTCRVESSGYQLPKPHETLAVPTLPDLLVGCFAMACDLPVSALTPPEPADSPPRLIAVTWQFSSRAAPSPRAPSRLS
jgi:hypothetical protein